MTRALIWIALATAVGVACSSTEAVSPRCIVGTTQECDFGPQCALGLRECVSDPPVWGDCRCELVKPPKPDSSTPDAEPGPTTLGQLCRKDSNCASGAFCLVRSSRFFFGGGPPKGVCVADCSASPTVCQKFPGAACVDVAEPGLLEGPGNDAGPTPSEAGPTPSEAGTDAAIDASSGVEAGTSHDASAPPSRDATVDAHAPPTHHDGSTPATDAGHKPMPTALCFQTCSLGPDLRAKCSGAPHVACDPLPTGPENLGFCRPVCGTNADCAESPALDGPARTCDVRASVCVDKPPGGDPSLGAACNLSEVGSCTGECVTVSHATEITGSDAGGPPGGPEATICSHRCLIGDPIDCGGSKTGEFAGACLSKPAGRAAGDVGYCRKLCDCSKDCPLDTTGRAQACIPFESRLLTDGFGRPGICTPASLATGTPLTCAATVGPDR